MSEDPKSAEATQGEPGLPLKPLDLRDADRIDGLKLIETGGAPTLLYSTEERSPAGGHELVIRAVSLGSLAEVTEVARIPRLLPPPPRWDARAVGPGQYEIVFEEAGGALYTVRIRNARGDTHPVSSAHPFESFFRPHFVRGVTGPVPSEIGAVAENKTVVVFPAGATGREKYTALVPGGDGVVGTGPGGERWVVAKTLGSGPAAFDVLPGQLALSRFSAVGGPRQVPFPDLIVFELDAERLGADVLVFATAKPAVLLSSARPARPFHLVADDRAWLLRLTWPTISVGRRQVRLAALCKPGDGRTMVLYGELPLTSVGGP